MRGKHTLNAFAGLLREAGIENPEAVARMLTWHDIDTETGAVTLPDGSTLAPPPEIAGTLANLARNGR